MLTTCGVLVNVSDIHLKMFLVVKLKIEDLD